MHAYLQQDDLLFAHNAAAAIDDADSDADVALSLLIQDFPTYLTWDKANKKGKTGQRRPAQSQIGRISSARPGHRESYYNRLLLCHLPVPVSLSVLRTHVDSTVAKTFREACRASGLSTDNLERDLFFTEAATHQKCAAPLRELFVTTP